LVRLIPRPATRAITSVVHAALLALLVVACGQRTPAPLPPEVDLTDMEAQVATRFRETRLAVESDPRSAEAWGRFGMVAHAHELWDEAHRAYRQAEALDPDDVRWPYYRADVLTVIGTDLDSAAAAFRRALELRPRYAPAYMRLGRVLMADGEGRGAGVALERALELEPGLQPARVTLAQIRLAEGKLELARTMLEKILEAQPRHAQALSTLGQVYMRQGRRDDAREVAERARGAAIYNLFSDPLMSEVVAEGVSSLLLWDRAKGFFDNGEYTQAALGLRQVVGLQPDNTEAHLQLAIALGNLGDLVGSRRHLERTVKLDSERVDARVRLAMVHLDAGEPAAAVPHLQRVLAVAPEDREAGWLLGRALALSGDLAGGLAAFETASAGGGEVPGWVHNEWGSALARTGRPAAALEHFEAALETNPRDAQAHFYAGLVREGQGDIDLAVEAYCRSLEVEPGSPAASRMQDLGRRCDFKNR
jgi:tetratricopeptide (TPR) repeat protein